MDYSRNSQNSSGTKFCKYCGQPIDVNAVLCVHCGRQVEELKQQYHEQPNIVINNANTNTNVNGHMMGGKRCDKWVAFILVALFGLLGAHKFYEGKIGMGLLYLFTFGLVGVGAFIDFFVILFKPNPYYV